MAEAFLVSIADLSQPGDSRHEKLVAPVEWSLAMSRLMPEPALEADLTLQAISGGIMVRGRVTATARHTCQGCLEDFDEVERVEVTALYLEDAEDDGYQLEGDGIDLEQLVRDEVLLALPMVPSCGDDCPGVVTTPGTDLNTGSPGETEELFGSPFDVLRDLLDPGT